MNKSLSGQLYVISAPSGAGKTSLLNALLQQDEAVSLSVSHTTRAPRPGEQNGVQYHFVDDATFKALVAEGVFLEHACVFDHYYGTSRPAIESQLASGQDVILEIDWQGAQQIRATFKEVVSIFIVPPSVAELRRRLSSRGQDSETVINRRMRDAVSDLSHFDEFDYLIVNKNFDKALAEIQAVFVAHRLKKQRQQAKHADMLAALLAESSHLG
ncbi:MAG: guanylate kinase [gamma proteobacterium symbiont of Bathyaustriella thionipta]|nr:guanylate kinase [gamma proteobacterium symbiont of Bathyaustriella thionipta]